MVVRMEIEVESTLAGAAGIMSIPTLMAFRDGILLYSHPGAMPASMLEELIAQVRTVDIDAVRTELGAAASDAS